MADDVVLPPDVEFRLLTIYNQHLQQAQDGLNNRLDVLEGLSGVYAVAIVVLGMGAIIELAMIVYLLKRREDERVECDDTVSTR